MGPVTIKPKPLNSVNVNPMKPPIDRFRVFEFYDSMLMIPGSLAKIASDFGLEITKDVFPHRFSRKDTLHYIGPYPIEALTEDKIKYASTA
ncbi:hypothetical protein HK100_009025 [Physocladia obscura]|uniref:Probable DNA polymerase n=1 Tax=Physocladia obscura TaxID=109957 RepID=A0AAD5T655_9FUNG|nr:hypothetical protein HK100_009025 [Physocladia obscura]